jgi:hypothetical protein
MSTKPNEINNLLALVREVCSIVGTGIIPRHRELHHMTKQERSEHRFATALEQFFRDHLTEDGVPDVEEARAIAEAHVDSAYYGATRAGR